VKFIRKLDNGIMAGLSWATSTKAAFYALTALIIVAVAVNPPTTIQGWLLVAVSEFYQGVALPGLGSASKRAEEAAKHEGAVTRKLLQETHDTTLNEFQTLKDTVAELKQMHREQQESYRQRDEKLDRILTLLKEG
jgi:hypothetical protein